MWYNVDYIRLVVDQMPTFLRKPVFIWLALALISPVMFLYDNWFARRNEDLYKLKHNGQVCYLRKALNDRFDQSLRRIYIGNGNRFIRKYIYTTAESQPRYLGTMYINSRDDYADTGVDFIVYAPEGIIDVQIHELQALIDYYKEGVKRYKIEPIL